MRIKSLLATALLAVSVLVAVPAGADTTTTTLPTTPTVVLGTPTSTLATLQTGDSTTTAPLTALTTPTVPTGTTPDYTSLAAAMVNYYAAESGQTLSAWSQTNSATMNSLLGGSGTGTTLTQLTNELTDNGAALNLSGVDSMQSLLSSVKSASSSVDGQATLTGMNLAQQLAGLYSTSAKAPSSDSAIFGLFYDQSLTSALSKSPNLFASVGTSLTSPSATAAWDSALSTAAASTGEDLSSLPDPCMVGMLDAMGTGTAGGEATGSSCGPCDVAGTFLNSEMTKIVDPATNNLITGSGGVSASAWSNLQGWLQSGTVSQNTNLAQTVDPSATTSSSLNSCAASSSATQGALSKTLPGVFSNLGTP
jgi:hypothetical protein